MATSPSRDLVTIDKSWVDLTLQVPSLPQHDQKVLGRQVARQPGGMGGNVACTASCLGLRTGAVSWVGDDADGRLILDSFRAFDVGVDHVVVEAGTATNYTVILLDPSGEKAIVLVPTATNILVIDEELHRYLAQARVVYAAPYDLEQVMQVAQIVHEAGGLLACDLEASAGLSSVEVAELVELVDILFTPAKVQELAGLEQEAHRWAARGPRLAAVTAGAVGAAACYEGKCESAASFEVPVVDTTGAGDCFTGAFLAAFLRGRSLKQALLYAQAAAAITVQAYGLRQALPGDKQIRDFLASYSQRGALSA